MACKAKESGKVSRRGQPSIEWYKDGKPQYYCYGYIAEYLIMKGVRLKEGADNG